MSFYVEMAQIAHDMIDEYGQAVAITHNSAGSYNPATGSAAITTITQAGIGAVVDYVANQIDGTLIQRGDKQLLLATHNISAPQLDDLVTTGGVTYAIKHVTTLAPAGLSVIYECQLRCA